MKLNNLPFLEKKEKPEYFLCLILRNEKAKAIIFEKLGTSIKFINQDEDSFPETIEETSTEEFLNILDKVISNAESVLPQNTETHKTIFALKESWVEDNKIKKEYLEKLKKAGEELALDPIGFLVFSESLINLIHKDEGAPATAILVELGKKYLTVSVVKAGKIIETRTSEIHQSAPFTVDTLLKHFQSQIMPSKIVLFDSTEEDLAQEFISHSWSKSIPFLHIPQIVSLGEESDVKAVLLGAATQMGTSLIFDTSRPIVEETVEHMAEKEELKEIEKEELNNETEKNIETDTVLDIKPEESPVIIENSSIKDVNDDAAQEYFGFSTQDVAKNLPPKEEDYSIPNNNLTDEELQEQTEEIPEKLKYEEEQTEGFGSESVKMADKIKAFLISLPKIFKTFKITPFVNYFKKLGPKKSAILITAILGLIALLFLLFGFSAKAEITLSLSPKIDNQTTGVTFTPGGSTKPEDKIIGAEIVSITEEGSVSVNTTGKKDVGTKAKGTVTVFNISNESISLASGTTITSTNGNKFTLDSSVKIASGSSDPLNPKSSTANVNVTAAEIGQEYNLPSGTKFTIGNNNDLAAKNDSAFSGGTKKSITVVSKDDLAKARTELPKKLEENAKNNIKSQIANGKSTITNYIDYNLDDENFDKKDGEEAKQITLTAKVNYDFLTYLDSDMELLAMSMFNNSDSVVNKSDLEVSAQNIKVQKNKDINADIQIKAKLYPKIDQISLAQEIAGVNTAKAKNILQNKDRISNVEIKFSPNLPFLTGNLPKNTNNIKINISAN